MLMIMYNAHDVHLCVHVYVNDHVNAQDVHLYVHVYVNDHVNAQDVHLYVHVYVHMLSFKFIIKLCT